MPAPSALALLAAMDAPPPERPSQEIPIIENIYSKVAALTTAPDPRIQTPFTEPTAALQAACCRLVELFLTDPDFMVAVFSIYTSKGCYLVTGGKHALPQDIARYQGKFDGGYAPSADSAVAVSDGWTMRHVLPPKRQW